MLVARTGASELHLLDETEVAIHNSWNNSLASECHLFKINVASRPKTYTLSQYNPSSIFTILSLWCGERQAWRRGSALGLPLADAGSWLPGAREIQTTLTRFRPSQCQHPSVLKILVSLPTSKFTLLQMELIEKMLFSYHVAALVSL